MKEIVIDAVIGKNGKTQLHVRGAQGEACVSLTGAMEARLGNVEEREYTPERYNWLAAEQAAPQGVYLPRG